MWVSSFVFSILQNCEMEETKVLNANNRNVEPIPDINTDSKPDKKKVRQSQRSELALRLKPKLSQEAKERQGERKDLKDNIVPKSAQCKTVEKLTQEAKERQGERVDLKSNIVEKLPQCKRVAEQLGEIAGVSGKIIDRVETILTRGSKEDIQALVLPLWAPLCLL